MVGKLATVGHTKSLSAAGRLMRTLLLHLVALAVEDQPIVAKKGFVVFVLCLPDS